MTMGSTANIEHRVRERSVASGPLSVVIGLEGLALGGCPINALDLARSLRDRGHRVAVFAIDEQVKVSLLPYAEANGFSVTLLPAVDGLATRSRHIRRFIKQQQADVVHVFGPWMGPAAAVAVAPPGRRRIAIVTNWNMENVHYLPAGVPMIVGTSLMRDEALGFHNGGVWLMEPPVDLDADSSDSAAGTAFRRDHAIGSDEVLAVIVSRIDSAMKAESLRYTIRAIEQLDVSRIRLAIVGDGDAFDSVKAEADAVNERLGRRAVLMTGLLNEPRPAYSAADITLGMGGSALRGLAHRKPLVVLGENGFSRIFDATSKDHFLEHGFFGIARSDDPVSLIAEHLSTLMDAEVRDSLGAFGLDIVRRRFSLRSKTDDLEDIYRAELAQLGGPAVAATRAGRTLMRGVSGQLKRRLQRVRDGGPPV